MKLLKNKPLLTSLIVGALTFAAILALKSAGIISIECTIQYLNPWQHSLSCMAYTLGVELALPVLMLVLTYFVIKNYE